ncbi:MAG: ATP-binding protein, partial [Methyloligellaceae bacterium]
GYSGYGARLAEPRPEKVEGRYTPVEPELDLAQQETLPPRPDGRTPEATADTVAQSAGRGMSRILSAAQRTTLAGMRVLDFNGIVVSGGAELGQSFAHIDEVRNALRGRYASVIRQRILDSPPPSIASISRGTGIRIFVALPITYKDRLWGVAYLSRTPKNILKHLYAEREKVILAGFTILALTFLLALLTSSTISWPISRLIERTRRVSAGDPEAMRPLNNPGTREMAQLAKSFSDMAISLHERSEYIRDFATHVSHEFKTPLTSIQGAAELLSEHVDEMSDAERTRFLRNITADTDRLQRLVSRLLELARADSLKPSDETFDVADALGRLQTKHADPAFEIILDRAASGTAKMSEDTFDVVLSNLLENARQHNAHKVQIGAKRNGKALDIAVADDGDGISAANRAKIFTPFFTTKREHGGTGLGLGIARSLLEAHRGSIRLADSKAGAKFVVRLPLA